MGLQRVGHDLETENIKIFFRFALLEEQSIGNNLDFWGVGRGFPGGSEGKASACSAGDLGSILGSGRSLGEGNGNPLQYSCLENPMEPHRVQSMGLQRVRHN